MDLMFSLLRFAGLCLITYLSGKGILRFLRLDQSLHKVEFLYPAIGLVGWVIPFGICVAFSIPLRFIVPLVWLITVIFVWCGTQNLSFRVNYQWVAIFLISLLASFPFVLHNFSDFLGSWALDGWAYTALGQYLWEYPRCTEGGLTPLYQFGASLCHTRFLSASLLEFFSLIAGVIGDAQRGMGYFLPWVFWVYATSVMFFAEQTISRMVFKWFYLLLSVLSGWLFAILLSNNLDSGLALSLLPVAIGIIRGMDFRNKKWLAILALITASVFYVYAEISLFFVVAMSIFFLFEVSKYGVSFRQGLILLCKIGLFAVLLVSPFLWDWFNFLIRQVSIISTDSNSIRLGGGFADELVKPNYRLIAFWGLPVGDFYLRYNSLASPLFLVTSAIASMGMTILSIMGVYHLKIKKEWAFLFILLVFLAPAFYFIIVEQYSYPPYKMIVSSWWLISFIVVSGAEIFIVTKHPLLNKLRWTVLSGVAILFVSMFIYRLWIFEQKMVYKDAVPFRELSTVLEHFQDKETPLAISLWTRNPNLWALYFTRHHPALYYPYMPFTPDYSEYMDRSLVVDPASISMLVTDFDDPLLRSQAKLVWQNPIYFLWEWKSDRWAYIAEITNPNGLDILEDGKRFYWLGGGTADFELIASQTGLVELSLDTIQGPSLPDVQERHLHIVLPNGGEIFQTVLPGIITLSIPVKPGKNTLLIEILDKPSLHILPSGDTRPLLLGIQGVYIQWLEP